MQSLSDVIETQVKASEEIASKLDILVDRVAELEKSDEVKVAQRMRVAPNFSWLRQTQAAETLLTDSDNALKEGAQSPITSSAATQDAGRTASGLTLPVPRSPGQ